MILDRNNPDHADVSVIATKFGGGGHRNAAGFRVDRLSDLTLGRRHDDRRPDQ